MGALREQAEACREGKLPGGGAASPAPWKGVIWERRKGLPEQGGDLTPRGDTAAWVPRITQLLSPSTPAAGAGAVRAPGGTPGLSSHRPALDDG